MDSMDPRYSAPLHAPRRIETIALSAIGAARGCGPRCVGVPGVERSTARWVSSLGLAAANCTLLEESEEPLKVPNKGEQLIE